jgi:predicted nucleic acid-binding protein
MSVPSASSPNLIVDASVCVWGVLPLLAGHDVEPHFARWREQRRHLAAPGLWLAEVTSAIRAAVQAGIVAPTDGRQALDDVLGLGVDLMPLEPVLARAAYAWSERLGQRRAYDGFYLAAADALGGELWTADQRLVNSARAAGIAWVHWIGEPA